MTPHPRARTHDRLAELVDELSGAGPDRARGAIGDAVARNGDDADHLLHVADALVALRPPRRRGRVRRRSVR